MIFEVTSSRERSQQLHKPQKPAIQTRPDARPHLREVHGIILVEAKPHYDQDSHLAL